MSSLVQCLPNSLGSGFKFYNGFLPNPPFWHIVDTTNIGLKKPVECNAKYGEDGGDSRAESTLGSAHSFSLSWEPFKIKSLELFWIRDLSKSL